MEKQKIINLINRKIAEHEYEMQHSQADNESIHKQLSQAKESLKLDKKDAMIKASRLMVLKDKAMFHKAAILTLEDLVKELSNE